MWTTVAINVRARARRRTLDRRAQVVPVEDTVLVVSGSGHEARGVLATWRKSGLSLESFAEVRGLVPRRVRRWRNKLDGAAAKPERSITLLTATVTLPAPRRANAWTDDGCSTTTHGHPTSDVVRRHDVVGRTDTATFSSLDVLFLIALSGAESIGTIHLSRSRWIDLCQSRSAGATVMESKDHHHGHRSPSPPPP